MSSDPTRLSDPSSGAPERLRRLFETGAADVPSSAELASLAQKLEPLLAAPPAGGPVGVSATVKVGAVAAVAVGLAVALVWRGGGSPEPAQAPATTAASATPPLPATSAPLAPAAPELSKAPSPPAASAASAEADERQVAAPSARAGNSPARAAETEAALLERARATLASNPARALALSDQHRANFPGGVLAQEREVIAIEALKRLGRADAAARRAADFARRYPGSAYQKKLDASPR